MCTTCGNTACGPSQYRAGSCSGTSNGYQCTACGTQCPHNQQRVAGSTCTSVTKKCECECKPGFIGGTCECATDPKHCNNLGAVLNDGSCKCQSGMTGQHCQCVSDSSSGTCLERANVADAYSGDKCDEGTTTACNGRTLSTEHNDTWCHPCADKQAAGDACQCRRATTCFGNGWPSFDGSCTCDTGFAAASNCKLCLDGVTETSSNPCGRCENKHAPFSYPLCNIDACTVNTKNGQDPSNSTACICNVGWYDTRCECYKGLNADESAPCKSCAADKTGPKCRNYGGTCAFLKAATTTTTATVTSTITTTTTTSTVTTSSSPPSHRRPCSQ